MSDVGPGKPPVEHQFKPGRSGNPGGLTSEQRQRIKDNADKAAKLQSLMLDAMMRRTFDPETGEVVDEHALMMIAADPQRFLKEAMDRGFGTAVQTTDHKSSDGSMSPTNITIAAAPDAVPDDDGED